MSKTIKEVLAETFIGPSPGYSIEDADANYVIEQLAAAGFVIAPKEIIQDLHDLMKSEAGSHYLECDLAARVAALLGEVAK